MSSQAAILLILMGGPALLRFIGFAEPVAAILAAAAALSVVLPPGAWGEVLDFVRVDGDIPTFWS
jgi:hypothetical protein